MQEDDYRGDFTEPATMNRYIYVGNNPVMRVDPRGHWSLPMLIDGTHTNPTSNLRPKPNPPLQTREEVLTRAGVLSNPSPQSGGGNSGNNPNMPASNSPYYELNGFVCSDAEKIRETDLLNVVKYEYLTDDGTIYLNVTTVDMIVRFTGDDATTANIEEVMNGFMEWETDLMQDENNANLYYTMDVNIEETDIENEVNVFVNIDEYEEVKDNGSKKMGRSGVYKVKVNDRETQDHPDNDALFDYNKVYMNVYTAYESDNDIRNIAKHEFGHVLGINDAYPEDNYERAPTAPKESIMVCNEFTWDPTTWFDPGYNITSYDYGVVNGEYDNYVRPNE